MTLMTATPFALLLAVVLSFCLTQILADDVLHLTPDNYDFMTAGRTVFIQFYAPWCAHCKRMAPDWERLADDWKYNAVGLVAQIDCTSMEGKKLCTKNKVRGFPTVMYGDPTDLIEYEGGRTYNDLAIFATENLKPLCSPSSLDLCDDATKKELLELLEKSTDDIEELIKVEKKKLKDMGKEFRKSSKALEDQYNILSKEKDDTVKEVRASGLDLAKSILALKEKKQALRSSGEL